MPAPTNRMPAAASGQGTPAASASATKALVSATVDPTDRSMPPVVITKVMATATISIGAACRSRLSRLPSLRNASVPSPNSAQASSRNSAMDRTWA